jgi:hypothetical protein
MVKSCPYRDPNYKRKWYLKNKAALVHKNRLLVYGISQSQFEEMFAQQKQRCKICSSKDHNGKNWHVDHDHQTGRIRGILCALCNNGLGCFHDNPVVLRIAVSYLGGI